MTVDFEDQLTREIGLWNLTNKHYTNLVTILLQKISTAIAITQLYQLRWLV